MRWVTFTGVAVLLLSMARPVNAGSTPQSFVRGLEAEVRTMLLVKDVARANDLFAKHLDMPLFGKSCLVDHWDEFSPEERLHYQDLLERRIRNNMNKKTLLAPEDVNFALIPRKVSADEGGFIRIDNLLRMKSGDANLGIILVKRGKSYRVVDYDFDGALLSRNYRGQFNYIIRKYGKRGFLDRLAANHR